MKSQAERDIDSVVEAHNRGGVEEANRVFAEVTKGIRMFECITLSQMIKHRIEDAPTDIKEVA
jgi:hypothetical protein